MKTRLLTITLLVVTLILWTSLPADSTTTLAPRPPITVCGTKWNDLDRDGIKDANELVLPGWQINLRDAANNVLHATTAANGRYCFNCASQGPVTIWETPQTGWAQTAPQTVSHHLTLVPGQMVDNADFGNAQICDRPWRGSYMGGRDDNFDTADGPEPASPGPELRAIMDADGSPDRQFDDGLNNLSFGHTFTGFASHNCFVSGATLTLRLRAEIGMTWTDEIVLMQDGTPVWNQRIAALAGGTWNNGQVALLTLNLAGLPASPIGVTNVLAALQDGDLDLYIFDDTSVDFVRLDVQLCCDCFEPPHELVAWWPFDETAGPTAYDFADNHEGTHINDPTPTQSPLDGALSFDGVDDYVAVTDAPDLNFGAGDFTIDTWIKTTSAAQHNVFLDKRSNVPVGYAALLFDGRLMFQLADSSRWVNYYDPAGPLLNNGDWHFVSIVAQRSVGTVRFYIDGAYSNSFSSTQTGPIDNTADLWIGRHHSNPWGGDMWFDGALDELEIYRRALSEDEINNIYSPGKCKKGKLCVAKWNDLNGDGVRTPNEPGLQGWSFHPKMQASFTGWFCDYCGECQTDATGACCMTPIIPGVYAVFEEWQDDWTQTYPPDPWTHTVTINIGQAVTGVEFGNYHCDAPVITYTTEADFTNGSPTALQPPVMLNVKVAASTPDTSTVVPSGQLELTDVREVFRFINVPASARGTVVRIDTDTGAIVGEYWSAPDGKGRDPSRTTVDQKGSVWVANRGEGAASGCDQAAQGSVTRIGLMWDGQRFDRLGPGSYAPNPSGEYVAVGTPRYTTCQDRDLDGYYRTSSGLGNIIPWANSNSVLTAEDECIINYTIVEGACTRTVAIDPDNNVWVGGRDMDHQKLDGVNGNPVPLTLFNVGCGGYGGLVTEDYILWSSRMPWDTSDKLLRYDTRNPSDWQCLTVVQSYGLAEDVDGDIWNSQYTEAPTVSTIKEFAPSGAPLNTFSTGGAGARGVAVTADNTVWIANSNSATVTRLDNTGSLLETIPVGQTPTGLAVDKNGNVWVTNRDSDNVQRIQPGPPGFSVVDMQVGLGAGAMPYTYSDMTGMVAASYPPNGFWQVTDDSGQTDTLWCKADWNLESTGVGESTIKVELRAANDLSTLSNATWITVAKGQSLASIVGRYLEMRVTLLASNSANLADLPILRDLTINACCAN